MSAPYPVTLAEAFAINAAGSDRNAIPTAPVGLQRASLSLGFPPQTMTPVVAGGKPMLGPDLNGILYMLSTHNVYLQSGQLYRWNSDVSTALGGYAIGTLLASVDGSVIWYNTTAANTTDPDSGGAAGWVAEYAYGISTLPPVTGGTLTLTALQAARPVIVVSGVLTSNQQIVLPNQYRRWLIVNTTTGAFQLTVKTVSGSGVAIPQGGLNAPVEVWSDTINIYNVVAPVNLPIDQAATPLTIVQRTNNGYVNATYFNQSSPLENFAVYAMYGDLGDGYFRKISLVNMQAQMLLSNFIGQVTNAQVPQSAVTQYAAAILASASLTGVPTTPTAAPGTATAQVASTAFVQGVATIGFGQTWSNALGRAFDTTYTNTTGRPIQVNAAINCPPGANVATMFVNGVAVGVASSGGSAANVNTLSAIVPISGTYSVNRSVGGPTLNNWAELR